MSRSPITSARISAMLPRISIPMLCLLLPGLATAAQICNPNVPATAPDERFQANADGTVTDLVTGLMWKQCQEGRKGENCRGAVQVFSWQEALARAHSTVFAGYKDWRLPNLKELESLLELGCVNPSINARFFPNTAALEFWTSTPSIYGEIGGLRYSWFIDFDQGVYDDNSRDFGYPIRLVRGGL